MTIHLIRNLLLLLTVGLVLGACAEPSSDESESSTALQPPIRGKKLAPVEIRAPSVDERGAHVEIVFGADATDVAVRTYGVEGLRVLGEEYRIRGGGFRRDETTSLAVPFDPSSVPGRLAVSVSGTFAGQPGVRAVTFTVGERGRETQSPNPNLVIEADGQPLHVTPARER